MKKNVLKLFRELIKLGKVITEQGVLIFEGDVLVEGTEVFIEDAEGNIIPAPDGTYDQYVVKDGKIAPIVESEEKTEVEPAQEVAQEQEVEVEPVVEEPKNDEIKDLNDRITVLETMVAELKAVIAELVKKDEEEFSALKPAEVEIKDIATEKKSGALKYFNK